MIEIDVEQTIPKGPSYIDPCIRADQIKGLGDAAPAGIAAVDPGVSAPPGFQADPTAGDWATHGQGGNERITKWHGDWYNDSGYYSEPPAHLWMAPARDVESAAPGDVAGRSEAGMRQENSAFDLAR